ncbi:MAG TPA: aspartate/glutamate racemase family protein [Hyphomicrobiaceae bacterium]|nr:aspartate/glutamate racemase family protein [Hyphomicrobiaceae bacterium]
MHIGLIGGIGPAATEYYYRGLIERHAASGTPLDLTIVNAEVCDLGRNLADNAPQRQAEIFAPLVARLAAAGARIAAVTSMGGHFCIRELETLSRLPILNAIPEVEAEIKRRGLKTIGILGTRKVMESKLYGALSSVKVMVPEGPAFDDVAKAYTDMASVGRVDDAQRRVFFSAGERLRSQGAEAIVLGGTDLFLAFQGQDCGFPLLDCAEIHVEAIYKKSLAAA